MPSDFLTGSDTEISNWGREDVETDWACTFKITQGKNNSNKKPYLDRSGGSRLGSSHGNAGLDKLVAQSCRDDIP